jgi:hypothetical protein
MEFENIALRVSSYRSFLLRRQLRIASVGDDGGILMALMFRIGRMYNPNCKKLKLASDGGVNRTGAPARKIFRGVSAEQVTTAFKVTPVVMVNSPRQDRERMTGPRWLDLLDAQTRS